MVFSYDHGFSSDFPYFCPKKTSAIDATPLIELSPPRCLRPPTPPPVRSADVPRISSNGSTPSCDLRGTQTGAPSKTTRMRMKHAWLSEWWMMKIDDMQLEQNNESKSCKVEKSSRSCRCTFKTLEVSSSIPNRERICMVSHVSKYQNVQLVEAQTKRNWTFDDDNPCSYLKSNMF